VRGEVQLGRQDEGPRHLRRRCKVLVPLYSDIAIGIVASLRTMVDRFLVHNGLLRTESVVFFVR